MEDWRTRVAYALVAVTAIVLVYSLLYQWAMHTYSGEEVSFVHSARIVIESLTTAGFGGDTDHWDNTAMHLVVILLNLSGVLLVFLALPLFAIPMFREAMEERAPRESDMTDHVIICGHSARDEVLSNELEAADIPYLYIDEDRDLVKRLVADGIDAIHGDSERVETFHRANAARARAVVADINDETNPTVILSADRVNPDIQILSVVRETEVGPYHRFAGADEVIEAPQVLAESLAMRAMASFAELFRRALEVETDLTVSELLVEEGSEMAGQTLAETEVFDEYGVTVIGGWFGGKFVISPGPDTKIEENTILLVTGHYEDFSQLTARPLPLHEDDPSHVVVCGSGVVGRAVADTLSDEGMPYDTIDIDPAEGPDVVGNVTHPSTLFDANIRESRAVVLALDDDTTTVYASLVISQVAPDVEIIARVHEPDNVWKLYNAGADFVLSMSVIAGEMLASHLLEDHQILTPQADIQFVRSDADALAGRSLGDLDVRARTGCTVVAVERDDELLTDLGADFVIDPDDVLVVSGSSEAVERFEAFAE